MENKSPEYQGNSWIWWSLGAILATAAITITLVGMLTGQWPWNRSQAQQGQSDVVISTETTGTEDTSATQEQTEPTAPETQPKPTVPEEPTVPESTEAPTVPATSTPTEPTQPKPTEPTQPKPTQPEETEPEETEPEQTQPTVKPTEPEEEEDEGGGEKPQPGDIDVPIGPRP